MTSGHRRELQWVVWQVLQTRRRIQDAACTPHHDTLTHTTGNIQHRSKSSARKTAHATSLSQLQYMLSIRCQQACHHNLPHLVRAKCLYGTECTQSKTPHSTGAVRSSDTHANQHNPTVVQDTPTTCPKQYHIMFTVHGLAKKYMYIPENRSRNKSNEESCMLREST